MLRHEESRPKEAGVIRVNGGTGITARTEYGRRIVRISARLTAGECRGIQVISKIEADRADWSFVANTDSNRMGNIRVIALRCSAVLLAQLRILLPPAQQVMQHVMTTDEDIAGIVENGQAEIVLNEGKTHWRQPQLKIVNEHGCATQRETRGGIAWAGLVQTKSAM